jgi:spore germination protein
MHFKPPFTFHLDTVGARYSSAAILDLILILLILWSGIGPAQKILAPLISPALQPLQSSKSDHEVFGFAPYFNFDKLSGIDFNVLTTLAYFGVNVESDGNLDKEDQGYQTFRSSEATELFKKAHNSGTKVVLTLTQMKNGPIEELMDNPEAQDRAINQAVGEVKNRGIDGINLDFEYSGNPGDEYRNKFSKFVAKLTAKMHKEVPSSQVTVSVYASSVKDPKIYDIKSIAKNSDGIFMMAYDFAVAGSDNAIPTAPLYGHKSGKYWYDVSTAVDDFLSQMSPDKLILGLPWYGYNYLVYEPEVKAETRPSWSWRGSPKAQSYASVVDNVVADKEGWDNEGKVGYKAYYVPETDTWRMVFLDDKRSLSIKYDFAKEKNLKGVGMWALGFDGGKSELWALLEEKFGGKLADNSLTGRNINENY